MGFFPITDPSYHCATWNVAQCSVGMRFSYVVLVVLMRVMFPWQQRPCWVTNCGLEIQVII